MTVSGVTMTSAVRQPVQRRDSMTQTHRSVVASRSRRGRVRCSTCSWCRNARISSWRAARECADVRRVWRTDRKADIMAQKRICGRPQHQRPQRERTFQQAQRSALAGHAAASTDGHLSHDADRLASPRVRHAAAARDIRSAGTASPVPKYISSGVCPRNAECGSTRLCSST